VKGKRFDDVETVEPNAMEQLLEIPKIEFQRCFHHWQDQWIKCVHTEGEYFESD
jgi:hypothetical protein